MGVPPSITNQPQAQEVSPGANVSFSVGVSGMGPISYQWAFNGGAIASATNSILMLPDVQATNDGSYSVFVTTPFGTGTSSNAVLTVGLRPIIEPQNQGVIAGSNATFSVAGERRTREFWHFAAYG